MTMPRRRCSLWGRYSEISSHCSQFWKKIPTSLRAAAVEEEWVVDPIARAEISIVQWEDISEEEEEG